jgi:plasmid stabilization system protein ParE
VKNKIEILQHSPLIGVECRHKKINQDCRVFIVDSYLVFYSVVGDEVLIRRILHSSVDYEEKGFEKIVV